MNKYCKENSDVVWDWLGYSRTSVCNLHIYAIAYSIEIVYFYRFILQYCSKREDKTQTRFSASQMTSNGPVLFSKIKSKDFPRGYTF